MGRRQHGESGYHERVARDVGGNARIEDRRGGSILVLACTGGKACEAHEMEYPMRAHLPPDMLTRQLTNRGWRLGKRVTCPPCMEKERMTVAAAAPAPAPEKPAPPPGPPAVAASEAARRATRLVFMALEEGYDDSKKSYREGWSDERVARETDASEAHVAKLREEHFGPLAEPPAIVEMRRSLAAVRAQVEAAERRVEQEGATVAALKQRLGEIEASLGKLARDQGWRT